MFYQGMIQAAVALAHVQRGNKAGAISVYLKSSSKLTQFPALWMGIELGQFSSELTRYFERCEPLTMLAVNACRRLNSRLPSDGRAGEP